MFLNPFLEFQDKIEVWEAALTFLFFPLLVLVAYAADKGWLNLLFCQSPKQLTDKQRQIELGTFQPGECKLSFQVFQQDGVLCRTTNPRLHHQHVVFFLLFGFQSQCFMECTYFQDFRVIYTEINQLLCL